MGNVNLNIYNFYGEDLHEGNGYGLFLMQYSSSIYIE